MAWVWLSTLIRSDDVTDRPLRALFARGSSSSSPRHGPRAGTGSCQQTSYAGREASLLPAVTQCSASERASVPQHAAISPPRYSRLPPNLDFLFGGVTPTFCVRFENLPSQGRSHPSTLVNCFTQRARGGEGIPLALVTAAGGEKGVPTRGHESKKSVNSISHAMPVPLMGCTTCLVPRCGTDCITFQSNGSNQLDFHIPTPNRILSTPS